MCFRALLIFIVLYFILASVVCFTKTIMQQQQTQPLQEDVSDNVFPVFSIQTDSPRAKQKQENKNQQNRQYQVTYATY